MTRTKKPRAAAMTPDRLRAKIAAAGYSITDFAERVGVARTTVTRWLNGTVPISRANAALIGILTGK